MATKQPAKKTATKTATKSTAKKSTAKKTATKSTAKKTTAKKTNSKPIKVTEEAIRKKAEEIYKNRVKKGLPGNAESDWIEAEKALSK